ncbi:uncharacterized protein LOC124951612 isoform X4 [Vespa velutina]|uniref:uncharacterized protein LOC124951612 isoform X4 n=1 Tax=Vespa velutina TaxID=202808 RepID=UPI001FB56CCB|nr:uncharacterized protein LOC124951612 isoform X4 [Vespa velutina]
MPDIKNVIELLCKHLNLSIKVAIQPEYFRLSKYNNTTQKSDTLWTMLHILSFYAAKEKQNDIYFEEYGSKYHCDAVLGYKKPETKMDLAICWQTPVDPIYEPPRSTHIDGSEGGAAPAIFELVQGAPKSRCDQLRSNNYNIKHNNNKNREIYDMNFAKKDQDKRYNNSHQNQNNCKHHCKCMDSMNIQKSISRERSRSQCSIRNSAVICENKEKNDPRLIKSAVGITLGTESNNASRRLPQKIDVPRPKTPFAKRSFSIETLSPPFSIVNGCRDTDYPEHWRLMTVYQQSYKNPRKYKANFHR